MRRLLAAVVPARLRGRLRRLHPDQAIAARGFDAAFYLRAYPDVAEAGDDPLEHYLAHGWREGRDPSAEFSTRAYIEAFPELADGATNPFVHYLTNGRPRVIQAEHPLGFRYEVISALIPMEDRVAPVAKATAALRPDAPHLLAEAFAVSRGGLAALHVTVSHDNYAANVGGVQLAIGLEATRIAEAGRDHLHLYPAVASPVVRAPGEPGLLGVVWNGEKIGDFAPAEIARVLGEAARGPAAARTFAIHSLLGHEADETADILAAAGLTEGLFWLHDFASVCAGYHLLRDDVEDCAAPPPGSAACGICVYGDWRARHTEAHARLFARLRLTVVSPSQSALDLWRRASDLPARALEVRPHAVLVERGPAPEPDPARPFVVAYAGLPAAHKGWPIFRRLGVRLADDPRYAFTHLGSRPDMAFSPAFEPVSATAADPRAMQAALERVRPDVVLLWPLCRETFSFVAYEAVAAGCAIVTGPDSGNVAAFVEAGDHGAVLADEAALLAAFESGEILRLARRTRQPRLYDLAGAQA
ncbi:MAG: hypothetical protein DI570_06345 [Phenylobacterium zucineum]|nr:MAG: hypothetical protein DI570_06345 [Phenylobacterium zucineum]